MRRSDTFCDETPAALAPLILRDAGTHPRYRHLLGTRLVGTRTYIGVPILLPDDRVFGTLCAHHREVLDLGRAEVDALLVLSRLLATQIERDEALATEADSARRLETRNAKLAEAIARLDALREIAESISAELELGPLLERIVASAVALLGAGGGAISLVGGTIEAPRQLTATDNLPAPPPIGDQRPDGGRRVDDRQATTANPRDRRGRRDRDRGPGDPGWAVRVSRPRAACG